MLVDLDAGKTKFRAKEIQQSTGVEQSWNLPRFLAVLEMCYAPQSTRMQDLPWEFEELMEYGVNDILPWKTKPELWMLATQQSIRVAVTIQ
jgi:hypothetical protein